MSDSKLIEERRDYVANELRRSYLHTDPIDQFKHWLAQAREAKLIDATAMALSTVDDNGQPHSRIVLLKNVNAEGFTFYTNYSSNKGSEMAGNARAALLFYWRELERQVRIEGTISKTSAEDSQEYFQSRPQGSRFSAAASRQSTPVETRVRLEETVAELHKQYPDGNVPRPNDWGGYLLSPVYFEFWQGRSDRLHDRFRYLQQSNKSWAITRLAP